MIVDHAISAVNSTVSKWRSDGYTVGLVPTMGYFHAGHLALMEKARELADKVVVSLFVNPAQFGPGEDLDVYPRDFEGDRRKAEGAGVDYLFCPRNSDMYSPEHQTEIQVPRLSRNFCGKDRPNHFSGVAMVVTKLFNIVGADYAVFGEKDYQQLIIIKTLVHDLNIPITIVGHPTVREPDGLAMSSRNANLSPRERQAALVLYKALSRILIEASSPDGERNTEVLTGAAQAMINDQPGCRCDYVAIVDAATLAPVSVVPDNGRVLGAMKVNDRVRLIDNMAI